MPKVTVDGKTKHFAYTPEGYKAAAKAKRKLKAKRKPKKAK